MIHAKSRLGPLSLLLVAVSACGSDASTGDAPPSATSQGDAGVADANASDANPFDAGTTLDAGASVDAVTVHGRGENSIGDNQTFGRQPNPSFLSS